MGKSNIGPLLSIQYLRAVAALMVVFDHAFQGQFPGFISLFPTTMGAAGVDIFFVISGFIMLYVTASREQGPLNFLLMRLLRIAPIYWIYTTGAAVLLLCVPWLFRDSAFTIRHFVLSLLFIPHDTAINPDMLDPIIKVGWTLNYEMFFYCLFAIAMWVSLFKRAEIASLAILGIVLGAYAFASPGILALFLANSIMLEFIFGMLIAKLYIDRGQWPVGSRTGAILLTVGFILLLAAMHLQLSPRGIWVGIPAAMIVFGAVTLEREKYVGKRFLPLLLGDASYSIYLVHLFPVVLLRVMWSRCGLPTHGLASAAVFVGVCLIVSAVGGVASYLLVERPVGSFLRGHIPAAWDRRSSRVRRDLLSSSR